MPRTMNTLLNLRAFTDTYTSISFSTASGNAYVLVVRPDMATLVNTTESWATVGTRVEVEDGMVYVYDGVAFKVRTSPVTSLYVMEN